MTPGYTLLVTDLDDRTAEIEYPCAWTYRLIGVSEPAIRELVGKLLGDRPFELERSHSSSGGKYVSVKLTVTVENDVQRLMLYRRFSRDAAIRYVL